MWLVHACVLSRMIKKSYLVDNHSIPKMMMQWNAMGDCDLNDNNNDNTMG